MSETFQVTGMTCGHCEKAVTKAIRQIDPRAEVAIDRATNKVDVKTSGSRADIAKAIEDEGYTVA